MTIGGQLTLVPLSDVHVRELESALVATTTMTRSNWQPVDFVVPVDGTIHGSTWRWDAPPPRQTARQKSLYPTAETALEDGGSAGPLVHEALLQPLYALGNVVAMPVLAFMDPPGTHMTPTAKTLYKRSIRGRAVAGVVPVDESADGGAN